MNVDNKDVRKHITITETEGNDIGNRGFVDQLTGDAENDFNTDRGVFYAFRDAFLSTFPDSFVDVLTGKMNMDMKNIPDDVMESAIKAQKKAKRIALKAAEDFAIKVIPTHSAIFERLNKIDTEIESIKSQLYQATNQIQELNVKINQILRRLNIDSDSDNSGGLTTGGIELGGLGGGLGGVYNRGSVSFGDISNSVLLPNLTSATSQTSSSLTRVLNSEDLANQLKNNLIQNNDGKI